MNSPRAAKSGNQTEARQGKQDDSAITPEVISGKPGPAKRGPGGPGKGPGPGGKRAGGPGGGAGPGDPGAGRLAAQEVQPLLGARGQGRSGFGKIAENTGGLGHRAVPSLL